MPSLLAFLFRNRLKANPNTVVTMEAYIEALLDTLRENCREYRVPVHAELDQVQGPAYMSAHPLSDTSFSLHAETYSADDYYAALKEVKLPEGVEMRNLKYNRRTETVSCVLDAFGMLHVLRKEMLEEQENKNS